MTIYSEILQGLIITALWSTGGTSLDGEEIESLDQCYDVSDLSDSTKFKLVRLVAAFVKDNLELVVECDQDFETIGHDLWLTLAGHGAGFWDGDYPEHGDALTSWCRASRWRDITLYIGDDDQIYIG